MIKPIVGIAMILGISAYGVYRAHKQGVLKPVLKGALYGLSLSVFYGLAFWLIRSA